MRKVGLPKYCQDHTRKKCGKKFAWEGIDSRPILNTTFCKGDRVNFSQDRWLECGILRGNFPQIFTITKYKDILIIDSFKEIVGGKMKWQVNVLRSLNDWEINEYENLLSTLSLITLDGSNNQPFWSLTSTEVFLVKSFYKYLTKQECSGLSFPFRQI